MVRAAWVEKMMSKTDRRNKIMDAQQTSEVRELTDAELESVNGGSGKGAIEIKDWSFGATNATTS